MREPTNSYYRENKRRYHATIDRISTMPGDNQALRDQATREYLAIYQPDQARQKE